MAVWPSGTTSPLGVFQPLCSVSWARVEGGGGGFTKGCVFPAVINLCFELKIMSRLKDTFAFLCHITGFTIVHMLERSESLRNWWSWSCTGLTSDMLGGTYFKAQILTRPSETNTHNERQITELMFESHDCISFKWKNTLHVLQACFWWHFSKSHHLCWLLNLLTSWNTLLSLKFQHFSVVEALSLSHANLHTLRLFQRDRSITTPWISELTRITPDDTYRALNGGLACQRQLVVYRGTPVWIKLRCPVEFCSPSAPPPPPLEPRLINDTAFWMHSLVTHISHTCCSDFTVEVAWMGLDWK